MVLGVVVVNASAIQGIMVNYAINVRMDSMRSIVMKHILHVKVCFWTWGFFFRFFFLSFLLIRKGRGEMKIFKKKLCKFIETIFITFSSKLSLCPKKMLPCCPEFIFPNFPCAYKMLDQKMPYEKKKSTKFKVQKNCLYFGLKMQSLFLVHILYHGIRFFV